VLPSGKIVLWAVPGSERYSSCNVGLVSRQIAARGRVADAMVTRPKTHAPESSVEEIRAFFDDEHVHMALVVGANGLLVTTIERADLTRGAPGAVSAAALGRLAGRTVHPEDPLDACAAALLRAGRRRLAVIDAAGTLLGLLCVKKDGTGCCSDADIRRRAAQGPSDQNSGSLG
jgi:CBS-domain-containing membrane protein